MIRAIRVIFLVLNQDRRIFTNQSYPGALLSSVYIRWTQDPKLNILQDHLAKNVNKPLNSEFQTHFLYIPLNLRPRQHT